MTRVPDGVPKWGLQWKQAAAQYFLRNFSISVHGSSYAQRGNYLDLDPTYRDQFGRPMLRMTFDFPDNDIKMATMSPTRPPRSRARWAPAHVHPKPRKAPFDIVPYQTTHNVGGTMMGDNPTDSVVNRYSQSWDVPNLFVTGAGLFPQNPGYNPTGTLAALAYMAADAIKSRYLKAAGRSGAGMSTAASFAARLAVIGILILLLIADRRRHLDLGDELSARGDRSSRRPRRSPILTAAHSRRPAGRPLRRGRYLAIAGDCVSCHTRAGRRAVRRAAWVCGRRSASSTRPTSPAIRTTGIGTWTPDQFYRALDPTASRRRDTTSTPPSPIRISPSSAAPIATRSSPGSRRCRRSATRRPATGCRSRSISALSMIGLERSCSSSPARFVADPNQSPEWNRGAYLVEGLGHCGACHTPHNLAGAAERDQVLQGCELE